jgi:hypothetical protein
MKIIRQKRLLETSTASASNSACFAPVLAHLCCLRLCYSPASRRPKLPNYNDICAAASDKRVTTPVENQCATPVDTAVPLSNK